MTMATFSSWNSIKILEIEQHDHNSKNRGCTQALRKNKQFLQHKWHPLCYACNKYSDKFEYIKGVYHSHLVSQSLHFPSELPSKLLLTRKILNQWYLVVKLKSPLSKMLWSPSSHSSPLQKSITNDHRNIRFVVIIIPFVPHLSSDFRQE